MMQWTDVPVYLHRQPVDFRKSINGLSALVEHAMGLSPFRSALFVFGARSRDTIREANRAVPGGQRGRRPEGVARARIKVLYWDQTGFCLWYKRLEKDRFQWPQPARDEVITLTSEQFDWLLRGLDILKMKPHSAQIYDDNN